MVVPSHYLAHVTSGILCAWILFASIWANCTGTPAGILREMYPTPEEYDVLPNMLTLIDLAINDNTPRGVYIKATDSCGGFIILERGDVYKITVNKGRKKCTAFFKTDEDTRLRFDLDNLKLADCEDEYLYLNDGATMETTLCNVKVAVVSQDSRFLLFQYMRQTDTGTALNFTVRAVPTVDLEPGSMRKRRALRQVMNDEQICPACGLHLPKHGKIRRTRVLRGWRTSVQEHPWIVKVHVSFIDYSNSARSSLGCGGSILDRRHILTAAHCLKRSPEDPVTLEVDSIYIVAGSDLRIPNLFKELRTQKIYMEYASIHRWHNGFDYDIAILTLSEDLIFNDVVSPVCLAPPRDFYGSDVTVMGYGSIEVGVSDPYLQAAKMTIFPTKYCTQSWQDVTDYEMKAHQVCLYSPSKDVCRGDSGGPAVLFWEGRSYQVGINGFAWGCNSTRLHYSGFARVSFFTPWIKAIIGQNPTC